MSTVEELRIRGGKFWDGAAPGWIRYAELQDEAGRPLGAPAREWLALRPGERVLEVGCAAGGTAAELLRAVAPGGTVAGVDVSPALVAAARRRFPDAVHPGLSFVADDIETMGVVDGGPYDAAFSRLVVMLLADPVAGCATVVRSLRPGGRFAATVFRDPGSSPWLARVLVGAAAHLGALPPLPIGTEPGPFALADPDRLRRVVTAAGFVDVEVSPHDTAMEVHESPDRVAEWLIEVGPAGAAYRSAAPSDQAAARSTVAGQLSRFRSTGDGSAPAIGYRLPVGLWLVTACTPPAP
jgi:SAM-dependent methyltransferase